MAVTEILARGFTFEVEDPATPGSYLFIPNVNSWSHSPQSSDADTTTFDDNGRTSHMKSSRGDEFTLSGYALEDPEDGSGSPGLNACLGMSFAIGPDSVCFFRITSPAGGIIGPFKATVTMTIGGGGNDDPSAYEITLTVTGPLFD
jgi:hypothetical protein